ncbi:MAG: hypothetical protein IIW15_05975, partial [Firmicutes bacterium]|nr:hypothetical protein [Bacillota bacterium]
VVIGKPFIVKVFRNTLRVNIVSAGLLIPDGILAILGIDNGETLVFPRPTLRKSWISPCVKQEEKLRKSSFRANFRKRIIVSS